MKLAELQKRRREIIAEMRALGERRDSWEDGDRAKWKQLDDELRETDAKIKRLKEDAGIEARLRDIADGDDDTDSSDRDRDRDHDRDTDRDTSLTRDRVGTAGSREDRQFSRESFATPRRQQRLRLFTGGSESRDEHDRNAHYTALWFRGVFRQDARAIDQIRRSDWRYRDDTIENCLEFRSLSSGDPGSGGYLVPEPALQAMIKIREEAGLRRIFRVQPMPGETLPLPKRLGGPTVYYPGEAKKITESSANYGRVNLITKERGVLTKVSNKLIADASTFVSAVDEAMSETAYELTWQEDNEIINGDGTGTYGGEVGLDEALGSASKHTLASTKTGWSDIVLTDFTTTKSKVGNRFWNDDQMYWIVRRDFFSEVWEAIAYAAGGVTTMQLGGRIVPAIMGYPVVFTSRMPDDAAGNLAALFGNFMRAAIIGDRQGIQLASSEHFAFDENVTTVRGTDRQEVNVHEAGDSSEKGAYAGLYLAAS